MVIVNHFNMKRYIKNGIIKPLNQIVLHGTRTIKGKDGKEKEVRTQIINPKEEMILADGWVEYVTPVYEPTIDDYRRDKIRDITRYDSSPEVNIFYIDGQELWLDKATRVGLKLRFDAEIASGQTNTALWHNGVQFPLELNSALQMLNAIELYASACYDNTQAHIANVKVLEDIESLKNYDYRTGYPEKLRF